MNWLALRLDSISLINLTFITDQFLAVTLPHKYELFMDVLYMCKYVNVFKILES